MPPENAGEPAPLRGEFAGRYVVERELGRGATALVYLARDTRRDRSVAIKVLRADLAQTIGATRFLREIKVNEKLQHPHIVPVLESGEHDGQLYFVLPYMEGGSLRHLLQRDKQLSVERAVAIARSVALALDYAHQQNLMHRDVKPENILFTAGEACLADFGIARAIERTIDESTTATGLVRGTPAYMSPEQASGSKDYDGRSDLYSLGCVLYEMIAGIPAFIGPTPEAVIAQRFQHSPRPLRVYRPNVPESLELLVDKSLSLAPVDRFPNAQAFADALAAPSGPRVATAPTPIAAEQPVRTRSWVRAGIAAGAVGVLAVAAAYWGGLFDREPLNDSRYLIIPVQGAAARADAVNSQLHESFGRWTDVSLVNPFEVLDAVTSTPLRSDRDAVELARHFGAGRYVRARMAGPDGALNVGLFDATTGGVIREVTFTLPDSGRRPAMDATVGMLLVGSPDAATLGTRSITAVQRYDAAMSQRTAFNLRAADSLFVAALEVDREFSRAALRLAEVRAWRDEPVSAWASWAERAVAGGRFDAADSTWAAALYAMARSDLPAACRGFGELSRAQPRAFGAWYGLATCLRTDNAVVRDSRAPSGWRYRSSYHQAVLAYERAFRLAPALQRSFQAGAYARLRQVLFADPWTARFGRAAPPDTGLFFAYPTWTGDSLSFVPFRASSGGIDRADPARWRHAVAKQREAFARIALMLGAALPNNAGAKEAVAIAFQLVGERSALDTLRAARRLADDPTHALRLAAEEVLMTLALGRTDSPFVAIAARLADSLMSGRRQFSPEEAAILAPIAAVVGRCRTAAHYSARAPRPLVHTGYGNTPPSVRAVADSLAVLAAMGCDAPDDSSAFASIESAVRADNNADLIAYRLLAPALRLGRSVDSARLKRAIAVSNEDVLRMRLAVVRGDRDAARRGLEGQRRALGPAGTANRSADGVLVEASTWALLGDTASARAWIDPVLQGSWFEYMLDRPVNAAALMRATLLRAELDGSGAKWASFVATLWRNADPELKPLFERAVEITKR